MECVNTRLFLDAPQNTYLINVINNCIWILYFDRYLKGYITAHIPETVHIRGKMPTTFLEK